MTRESNAAQEIPFASPSKAQRLLGWLVSYGLDSNGAAFELRTGRSFISSTALLAAGHNGNSTQTGERCILLKHDGIASLHVALLATTNHQLFIQDIFSDHGTFIVKAGSEEEKKVTGTTEIDHGDWIRIGEKVRFQVCMIDGRRK